MYVAIMGSSTYSEVKPKHSAAAICYSLIHNTPINYMKITVKSILLHSQKHSLSHSMLSAWLLEEILAITARGLVLHRPG